jgi:hypothetical protein
MTAIMIKAIPLEDEPFIRRDYRVVDTGDSLTVGLVEYDPLGSPATVTFDLPEADNLGDLLTVLSDFSSCVRQPVLRMRDL